MPADQSPGLSELEAVLRRIGRTTLREDLGSGADYADLARRFYFNEPSPPTMDPGVWLRAALMHDPEHAIQQRPVLSYDDAVSNVRSDGEPISLEDQMQLARMENSIAGGYGLGAPEVGRYQGIGWSRKQLEERGGNFPLPEPGELSPGDIERHQRLRDIQYLQDMLERRDGLYDPETGEALPVPHLMPSGAPGQSWDWTGLTGDFMRTTGGGATDEERARHEMDKRTQDALQWHRKGVDAQGKPRKYAFGDGTLFSTNQTANFRRYGGYMGTAEAADNPDYLYGLFSQNISTPLEWATNRVAMRDAATPDDDRMAYFRKAGGFGYLGASLLDLLSNAPRNEFANHPLRDAQEVAKASQIHRASPLLPTRERDPDVWERSNLVRRVKETLAQTMNLSASDHYRGRTGENMSFLGQIGATGASGFLDPTIASPALGAKPGAKLARVVSEASEEWPGQAIMAGVQIGAPRPEGLRVPEVSRFLDSKHRPDLPAETDDQHRQRLLNHPRVQDNALLKLREMNAVTPGTESGYSAVTQVSPPPAPRWVREPGTDRFTKPQPDRPQWLRLPDMRR